MYSYSYFFFLPWLVARLTFHLIEYIYSEEENIYI